MNRLICFAAAVTLPALASAHVSVWPKESIVGAREKLVVRVPNEKAVDTIAVELRFPAGLKVKSVEQQPGWMTEPVRDSAGGLVAIRWTGKLAPQQFVEFGLLATMPAKPATLTFSATQMFADGTRAEWTGGGGSAGPAPQLNVRVAP